MSSTDRTAVVLFNLGGPDSLAAVRPFLFNLFNDPAIIRLPRLPRWLLAQLISGRRAPIAREIYAQIGGASPLLANTLDQAVALKQALVAAGEVEVFIAMRYWHPMAEDTAAAVAAFAPDRVLLLPLYPQWSTTTTASSLAAWRTAARRAGITAPSSVVCCYPTNSGLIDAMAALIKPELDVASAYGRPRLLLSAHGLPKRVVAAGDPYQWQCEQTVAALVNRLGHPELDWVGCYQSRVGPLEWIGPSTDQEISRAGRDRVPVVIAPIAFVSEHSETLVEIEIEYRHLAQAQGVPYFGRVPAVGTAATFIAGLAGLVRDTLGNAAPMRSGCASRFCPAEFSGCALSHR
ncbi:MAG: ferrochelatase [Azospirillum sp.]|nr:ferrochelatase [Azospirillum sp.]